MNRSRVFAIAGILVIAVLLAFPLRDAAYALVIVPLAYVWWVLGLLYHAVNQAFWWLVVLLVVGAIFSRSLLPQAKVRPRVPLKGKPLTGPVEDLAVWMRKTNQGIYFKWLVANRLGKIASQILSRRESGKKRTAFDPLTGPAWYPKESIQRYLEVGLQGSFADYAQGNNIFASPSHTPLDQDLSETIAFLETQTDYQ